MTKGLNKADLSDRLSLFFETKDVKNRPCVFLSHKKEDKPDCRQIAEYFKNAEINYYLDELDDSLQQAVSLGDVSLITESIKKGIRESSHMLVVVSEKTYKSQWVPFEIGYGHAAIIDKFLEENKHDDKIKLAILTLKDISEKSLPDFMQAGYIIRGTKSLNEYVAKITGLTEKSLLNETRLFSNSQQKHPLDNVLNWKL